MAEHRSEVAQLTATIEAEYAACRLGCAGLASGIARHALIRRRMERMEIAREQLVAKLGEEAASPLIAQALEQAMTRD